MQKPVSLPRVPKGKRPHFFEDKSTDHLLTMVLEMSTELYAVYSRLDSLERYLAQKGSVDLEQLDGFKPDEAAQNDRLAWREQFLERLFRTVSVDQG